jgi:septum formation protein
MLPIFLASSSPQRARILGDLGLAFTVVPSTVDEAACGERHPEKRAALLAKMKAEDVAREHCDALVIGCDTLVVAPDGTLLEKPLDAADARRMLRLQSGGISLVHSALCILGPHGAEEGVATSRVHFASLNDREIDAWLARGLWEGRSGAFQIDGPGQMLVTHMEGEVTAVIGLPVFLLRRLLCRMGHDIL